MEGNKLAKMKEDILTGQPQKKDRKSQLRDIENQANEISDSQVNQAKAQSLQDMDNDEPLNKRSSMITQRLDTTNVSQAMSGRQSKTALQPLEASDLIKTQSIDIDNDTDSLNQSYPAKNTDPKKASFKIKSRPASNQGNATMRPSLKNVQRDITQKGKNEQFGVNDAKTGIRRQSNNMMNQTMNVQKPKMDRKLETMASTTNLKMKKIAEEKESLKEEYNFTQGMKIVNHLDLKGSFKKRLKSLTLCKSVEFEDNEVFVTRFNMDDSKVAVGLADGNVTIMNTNQTDKKTILNTYEDVPVTSIRWVDNNTIIAGNAAGWFVDYDV